ncbi:MAG: hypothetical protein HOW73_24695 [Polyangiaceae bacterium]|nr:hypothetical protein [Polyangiaceae bacterium]
MTETRRVPYRSSVVSRSTAEQLLASLLFAAVSLSAGCAAEYDEEPRVPRKRVVEKPAPAPTAEPKQQVKESALLRPLYHDDWFGGVTLLGVDEKKLHAVVKLEAHDPPRIAIDTIDLRKAERIDRWEATGDPAERAMRSAAFTPLSGSFEKDLSRYATLVRDLGPWHLRHPLSLPTFAVAPDRDHVLFGSRPTDGTEGDWLFAVTNDGKPRRVDQGLLASYSPVFSPDGTTVAFIGCTSSPCDYGLFLTKMGEDKPRRVAGIQRATAPMWSSSGDSVLAVGGARSQERCLFRLARNAVTPKSLACAKGLEDVSFALDPEGRTAAMAGVRGVPGKQVVDVKWILLADGSTLATHTIDRAVGSSVLSASGLMALPMQRGAVGAVDLISGSSTVIPESEGWFFGFEGARWVGDTLVLLRKVPDKKGFDIVAIDVRKASGRRDEPWL